MWWKISWKLYNKSSWVEERHPREVAERLKKSPWLITPGCSRCSSFRNFKANSVLELKASPLIPHLPLKSLRILNSKLIQPSKTRKMRHRERCSSITSASTTSNLRTLHQHRQALSTKMPSGHLLSRIRGEAQSSKRVPNSYSQTGLKDLKIL